MKKSESKTETEPAAVETGGEPKPAVTVDQVRDWLGQERADVLQQQSAGAMAAGIRQANRETCAEEKRVALSAIRALQIAGSNPTQVDLHRFDPERFPLPEDQPKESAA